MSRKLERKAKPIIGLKNHACYPAGMHACDPTGMHAWVSAGMRAWDPAGTAAWAADKERRPDSQAVSA